MGARPGILALAGLALAAAPGAALPAGGTVGVCTDSAEWPPYVYYRRVDGRKTAEVQGFAVDVLKGALAFQHAAFRVKLMPLSRCLAEVRVGEREQVGLSVFYTPDRARHFYYSRPFAQTTGYYFYSKRLHPNGLAIRRAADLRRYRICGSVGYSYRPYGLEGVRMDLGSRSFAELHRKVKAGRCDLFVGLIQVISHLGDVGPDLMADPDLGYAPVPGMPPIDFHMVVSRRSPRGKELVRALDDGLGRLERSGELAAMRHRYGLNE